MLPCARRDHALFNFIGLEGPFAMLPHEAAGDLLSFTLRPPWAGSQARKEVLKS
jgi:hypothetical protein